MSNGFVFNRGFLFKWPWFAFVAGSQQRIVVLTTFLYGQSVVFAAHAAPLLV